MALSDLTDPNNPTNPSNPTNHLTATYGQYVQQHAAAVYNSGISTASIGPGAIAYSTVTQWGGAMPEYFAPNFADTIFGGVYRAIWRYAHVKDVKCAFYGEKSVENMEYELSLRLSRGGQDVDLDMCMLYETMHDGGEEALYAFLDTVIAMLPTPVKPTQEALSSTYMTMMAQQSSMMQIKQQMAWQQAAMSHFVGKAASTLQPPIVPTNTQMAIQQLQAAFNEQDGSTRKILLQGIKRFFVGKAKP